MIKREDYLKTLINRIGNGSVNVITGLRRVGKSTLLNDIFYYYLLNNNIADVHNIIKFSFDSAEDLEKIGEDYIQLKKEKKKVDPKKFTNYIKNITKDDEKYFLLLDEVQEMDAFSSVLISYLAKGNFELFVTGSNSRFLSSEVSTEFRGKGTELHVNPFNFKSFYEYSGKEYSDALNEYMLFGGLPRVILSNTFEDKTAYLEQQLDKTYLTDIIDRNDIKNVLEAKELLNILASDISCLTNPKKLSNAFKSSKNNLSLSEDTIASYIKCYKDAFILNQSLRYDVKGKAYISTPYKIYFEDLGIRNCLLNFRQIEESHLTENLIYNELRQRNFKVDVGVVETRENGSRKYLEVDFVANKGWERYYIQSALDISNEEKNKQEIRPYKNIKDSFKKIIIVKNHIISRPSEDGYLYLSLKDFLLDDDCLKR